MARAKVLIVEDEIIVGKDIQMSLKNLEYTVSSVVTSGKKAIEDVEKEKPDLVVMDIMLPGEMDGIETARQIRSRMDIPVIYLTANTDEEMLQRAKVTEPYGYIVKPFEKRELHSVIQMALYKHAMERKLKESEERYHSLITNIPEVTWIADGEGKTVFISPNVEKVLGCLPEEIYKNGGHSWFEWIHPEDLENVKKTYRSLFEKGMRFDIECRVKRKDGVWIWLHDRGVAIYEKDGVWYGSGIFSDVSGRRQAEKEIRVSKESFHNIVNNNTDGIVVLDRKGKVRFMNPATGSLFGRNPEKILCKRFSFPVVADTTTETDIIRRDGQPGIGSMKLVETEWGGEAACLVTIRDITESKQAETRLKETLEKLRKVLGKVIQTMALTIEKRDPYTAGHQRRVADLARYIATEMGLSEERVDGIRMAGMIHDLGKIAVPAEILSKPYQLSEIEFEMIKIHSRVGYDILKSIEFSVPIDQIVLQHHEKIDGSGYPQGLSGKEILLESRILTVADVVEAIASHRPYRPAWGIDKALEEITQKKGVLYDPDAVDACLEIFCKKKFKFL